MFFNKKIDWLTNGQLSEIGEPIIDAIVLQLAVAAEFDDREAVFLELITSGFLYGYIFGFVTRCGGVKLEEYRVKLDYMEANEERLIQFVVGNVINPVSSKDFDKECENLTTAGSRPYLEGVQSGTLDADKIVGGSRPDGFLAKKVLATRPNQR